MIKVTCCHCGELVRTDFRLPAHCPHCHAADYHAAASVGVVVARLKLAVRDILRGNPFAGILRTPDGYYLALIPYMCDRAISNPELYGELQGIVTDIEQIEPMLFGAKGLQAARIRSIGSRYQLSR